MSFVVASALLTVNKISQIYVSLPIRPLTMTIPKTKSPEPAARNPISYHLEPFRLHPLDGRRNLLLDVPPSVRE